MTDSLLIAVFVNVFVSRLSMSVWVDEARKKFQWKAPTIIYKIIFDYYKAVPG